MSSKLAKNTSLYTIGTLLPQVATFILLPIYTRYLTPADYGILNAVQVINSVLVILYTLSIDKAIYRLYYDFKSDKEKKDYLGTIFIGVTFSVIIITGLLFAIPDIVGSIYKNINFYPYMALSILASSLATFIIIPRSAYFVQEKAGKYITLSITEFIFRNIFIIIFVVGFSKGVFGYLQGQLVGSALLVPLFLYLTYKQINIVFKKSYFLQSIKFSLPMLPMLISAWTMSAIDRIFIERYFNTNDVGIYSLGYKIGMMANIISGSFYKAYNPFYFKTATQNEVNKAKTILKKTNTIYLLAIILACSTIALFSKEIVEIFFDERYQSANNIIAIVSLAFVFGGLTGIFNLAIYQEKKTMFLMYVNIAGALINIGFNFLLIPTLGAYGAAWATVITYIALMLFGYFYAVKCFYASFNYKIVFTVFTSLFIVNILFYFTMYTLILSILLKCFVLVIILIIVWFLYKSEINILLKNIK